MKADSSSGMKQLLYPRELIALFNSPPTQQGTHQALAAVPAGLLSVPSSLEAPVCEQKARESEAPSYSLLSLCPVTMSPLIW